MISNSPISMEKIMMSSSHLVAGSKPNFQFCPNPHSVSFNPHVTKSRISVKTPARPTSRIEARYAPEAAKTEQTLYELLGLTESGSTFLDIKKAYRRMARMHHPDVSPPERVDEYTKRFIMVHQAYETLSNPQTRASYDRALLANNFDSFSAGKSSQYHQGMEENREWKMRWQTQLEKLKRRETYRDRDSSWGARMRAR